MFGKLLRCSNDVSEFGWIRRMRADRLDAKLENELIELSHDTA
jgi:hypothetical protein